MCVVMGNSMFLCVCIILGLPTSPIYGVFVKSENKNSSLLTFLKGDLVSREGRKCHDFCTIMPDWCRNGGVCVTEETTCIGRCICTTFWTGQRCDVKRALDPPSLSSFVDVLTNRSRHGDVHGRQIDQRDAVHNTRNNSDSSDTLLAMLHSVADIDTNHELIKNDNSEPSISIVPSNDLKSLGNTFSNVEDTVSTSTSTHSNDFSRLECIQTCHDGDCIKINDVYKCKHRIDASTSQVEKVCGPGFVCVHGVCDLEAKENNSYDCICESNYVGQFCDYECPFDCGQHGFCDYDVSGSLYKCFCQWNYTGFNCSQLIPTETELLSSHQRVSFHWYVLGASVTIVILILAGSLLAGYFLWKKRLVFVLKIVHFFKDYEDDDGKEFDAFVSYRSTERDEKFVLTELYPRLEGTSKFKLCLHFRDFEPGEAIANNIVRAIENSRRTIIILSPSYIKSEWCRLEYQKAQHEMLKLKHKIIPIVLEDITDVYKDLDTNLKSILDSVTYLEWPGSESDKKIERFWKKLELSLPKKSTESSSLPSSSSSSETSSKPLSDISITSSSESNHSSSSKPALTISMPNETTSKSSESLNDIPKSHKTYQRRRKNFRHFIDKFVCNKLQFNRQDSGSSQMALVDEETAGSRSSCDSVSESILTESTESICSTPLTTNTDLDETIGETCEPSSYFSLGLKRRDCEKEKQSVVCEKDHCEGTTCLTCLTIANQRSDNETRVDIDDGTHVDRDDCELCRLEQVSSDNNRVKISVIEGSDQIRIQRLPGQYRKCNHGIQRGSNYRGSLKNRKEAVNRELSVLNRAGTLPRNFRSQILAKKVLRCDDIVDGDDNNRAIGCKSDNTEIYPHGDNTNSTHSETPYYSASVDSGKSFSSNGFSSIESDDSLTYNGIISIDSGDSLSSCGSSC